MRKSALLSALVAVILSFSLTYLSAQEAIYTYIRYDESTMDRLDHQFIEANNSAFYTSYRITTSTHEKIFFDIGIESPRIHKKEPPSMASWQKLTLDQNFVVGINTGRRKVFICKKLDSGWAVQAIGSAIYLSNSDNVMTFVSSNYDFKADFNQTLGNNLALNTREIASPANVFYIGELAACSKTAKTFKVFPSETRKYETTITVLPDLGLIRENAEACPTYELININGVDVCTYLGQGERPSTVTSSESQPEQTPDSYNTVTTTGYIPVEEPIDNNGDIYVKTKTIVENTNITKSDNFDENTTKETPTAYSERAVAKAKPAKTDCDATAAEGEHIVQSGENLYSISRRYGLAINSLREWNKMSSDKLAVCTRLKIAPPSVKKAEEPKLSTVPKAANTAVKVIPKAETKTVNCDVEHSEGEHIVMQGENLYGIARKYNVTYDQLLTWNKLQNDLIKPCQKIIVTAPKVTITPKSVQTPTEYKVVIKGKTPNSPVKTSSKSSVEEKPQAKIHAAHVKKGTGLHVVEKDETVAGLAKRFEMTETDFRKINFLEPKEKITLGQVVRTQSCACTITQESDHSLSLKPVPVIANDVPKGYKYVGTKSSKTIAKGLNRKYHVVQSTETLYSISKNYGKSLNQIRKLNNLTENEVIVPNQLIILE